MFWERRKYHKRKNVAGNACHITMPVLATGNAQKQIQATHSNSTNVEGQNQSDVKRWWRKSDKTQKLPICIFPKSFQGNTPKPMDTLNLQPFPQLIYPPC